MPLMDGKEVVGVTGGGGKRVVRRVVRKVVEGGSLLRSPSVWCLLLALTFTWSAVAVVMFEVVDVQDFLESTCHGACPLPGHIYEFTLASTEELVRPNETAEDSPGLLDRLKESGTDLMSSAILALGDLFTLEDDEGGVEEEHRTSSDKLLPVPKDSGVCVRRYGSSSGGAVTAAPSVVIAPGSQWCLEIGSPSGWSLFGHPAVWRPSATREAVWRPPRRDNSVRSCLADTGQELNLKRPHHLAYTVPLRCLVEDHTHMCYDIYAMVLQGGEIRALMTM
uniref:uncharacterized protein n=1 Tax=Myxine glutinosa TaxID=7769 RepID=UPI00359029D1